MADRYLLESSSVDGYLLESGSGVLMLETSLYLHSDAAGLTFTGAITKQGNKALAAALSFTGAITRAVSRALTAGLTPAGSLVKQTQRALAGTLSFTGSMTYVRLYFRSFAATLDSAASLVKRTGIPIAATLTSGGALTKITARLLTAATTPSGVLTKLTNIPFSANLSSSGTLVRQTRRALSATLSSAGIIVKRTNRSLAASLSSSGVLSAAMLYARAFAATLSSSASLSRRTLKSLLANLTPSTRLPGDLRIFARYTPDVGSELTGVFLLARGDIHLGYILAFGVDESNSLGFGANHRVLRVSRSDENNEAGLTLAVADLGLPTWAQEWSMEFELWGDPSDLSVRARVWPSSDPTPAFTEATDDYPLIPRSDNTGSQHAAATENEFTVTLLSTALTRLTSRTLAAGLSFSAVVNTAKVFLRSFAAELAFTGSMAKRSAKALVADLGFVGQVTKVTSRGLSAALVASGGLSRRTSRQLTASLSFVTSFLGAAVSLHTLKAVGSLVVTMFSRRTASPSVNAEGKITKE